MRQQLVLGCVVIFCSLAAEAGAQAISEDGLWQETPALAAQALAPDDRQPWVQPEVCRIYLLDVGRMRNTLATAPLEDEKQAGPSIVSVPLPNGEFARFEIVAAPVMAPELAAKFPEITTYLGIGVDDPFATARIDYTPAGFHAQILSPEGAVYVDPYWQADTTIYASYYKRDYRKSTKDWSCLVQDAGGGGLNLLPQAIMPQATGLTRRTYRLACAATGEYTAFHGGTVSGAMSGIVTTVNRVVGIYERELAIRLTLVANNNLIVYTNSSTDPYSNNDGGAMLSQNQTAINNAIGSANYDIGHVFSTGGGGVAYLGCVCKSNKAGGVTGSGSPIGDAFDVDYVAHEMGHQFGANHSFNGSLGNCTGSNRNASTAYEPGSGTTIMCYAGICDADDLQPHSDPFFHSIGIEEITAYTTAGTGLSCAVTASTNNQAPSVNAGPDYTIPANTPFTLTATGSDPDGEPLIYSWEQRDLGPQAQVSAADNGSSPLFRAWPPSSSPSRTFPRLSDLLNNTTVIGERLPTTSRVLHFRVMARDHRATGGTTASDNANVTVTTAAGPFRVTAPNTAVIWDGLRTVTWNVANTTASPVSTASVDILLSTDGGNTFPTVLAAGTPNDGSQAVTLPNVATSTARIMVRAAGNIYFDISDVNFSISNAAGFVDTGLRTIDDTAGNGNGNGVLDPGETAVHLGLQIRNDGTIAATGVSAVLTSLTATVAVTQPNSAYPDMPVSAAATNSNDFVLAIAANHSCGSPVNLRLTVTSPQGGNAIDYSFTTGLGLGSPVTISYTGPAVAIPDLGTAIVPLTVGNIGAIGDLNFRFDGSTCSSASGSTTVGLDHTFVGDLIITLISPAGTSVTLANRPGGGSGNNFCQTLFDDDGPTTSIQSSTAAQNPFSGAWLPAGALSAFDGQNAAGTWQLRVQDAAGTDTGNVRAFSLILTPRICTPALVPADFDRDGDVDQSDVNHFRNCATGASIPITLPSCANSDLDLDMDADQNDFGEVQRCISGENTPADPLCAAP